MSDLSTPDDPEDLWLASDFEDVPQARMLMQGDIIAVGSDPVCVVSHACSMRRGSQLHETQIVAPVRDQPNALWNGSYDWMPLPGLRCAEIPAPAANLREIRSESTASLLAGRRIGVMADTGIHLLQQRMAHHLTRVVIALAELAEHCAPVLAEADLHEEWVTELGAAVEPDFHTLLDRDNRKLRAWLEEARTRHQAIATIRKEIRARKIRASG
ncbi:MAG: hypothetical protein OXH86_07890 [Acidimicrobiaceae bacterium]|nr:hypothetical protein [Acidimicrobiaceae bacterium]